MEPVNIHSVCDFVVHYCRVDEPRNSDLNHLKLHKLLYYIQAWHLAFYKRPLFIGSFQAWVHGPVNRQIYDRFKDSKYLYSLINHSDVTPGFSPTQLPEEARAHINSVLEAYAPFSPGELEEMTHRENPWLFARNGYGPDQYCEVVIDEQIMGDYYRSRIP